MQEKKKIWNRRTGILQTKIRFENVGNSGMCYKFLTVRDKQAMDCILVEHGNEKQTISQTDRHTYRRTERQIGTQTQTERQKDRQIDRQTERQIDRQNERQAKNQ